MNGELKKLGPPGPRPPPAVPADQPLWRRAAFRLWLAFYRMECSLAANMLDPWERVLLHGVLLLVTVFSTRASWRMGCWAVDQAAEGLQQLLQQARDAVPTILNGVDLRQA